MREEVRDHVNEIAEILAAGLLRLLTPKSSPVSPNAGESSLDLSVPKSRHVARFSKDDSP